LAFKRRQVSPSASSSFQDQQAQQPTKSIIPTQKRVTEQLTKQREWAEGWGAGAATLGESTVARHCTRERLVVAVGLF